MDALLPVFVAVLIAETGGRTQALAHELNLRFGKPNLVINALVLVALISMAIAAAGGMAIGSALAERPARLMLGLALVAAGVPMLLPERKAKPPREAGPWAAALGGFGNAQLGGSSQFIVFAVAIWSRMPLLSAAAGVAAILAAAMPAIVLRQEWPGAVPVAAIRRFGGAVLTGTGLWVGLGALRLI